MSTSPDNPTGRPAPRPSGRLRRLAAPFVHPPAFDFWASRLHRTWSWQRPLARIVAREAASSDAVTLVLKPNRHWRGFAPGQHVNLGVEVDGTRFTRSYSLCDVPRRDGRIAITVKAVDGGKVSRHLHANARVGDVLDIGPAFGALALPADNEPVLLLAAGSGITPLMALLRQHAARGMPAPITLLYWSRRREQHCYTDELRALVAMHPRFDLHLVLTGEAAFTGDEAQGRIDATLLSTLAPDFAQRHVLACGPGGFVDTARALCADARSFDAESFSPPPRTVEDTGTATVTLARSGRTLDVPRGQSLLEALEAHGLKPASGCRMGICNTCACGKSEGSTRHRHTGDIEHEPVSALRLCINSAAGDLVLDL